MNRSVFLTLASFIALGVGVLASASPAMLLESKGVAPRAAAEGWVRQVGVILVAIGMAAFAIRRHPDSPTLRAFLWANAVLQIGLLPIEVVAYSQGVITRLAGIVPNTVLHAVLAAGFAWYAARCHAPLGAASARE